MTRIQNGGWWRNDDDKVRLHHRYFLKHASFSNIKSSPPVNTQQNQATKQGYVPLIALGFDCFLREEAIIRRTIHTTAQRIILLSELQQTTTLQQRHAGALPSCIAADADDANLKHRIGQQHGPRTESAYKTTIYFVIMLVHANHVYKIST